MKFFKTLFVIILPFLTNYTFGQNSMILNLSNNTSKSIPISNIDKVTFSSGNIVVSKNDVTSESFVISDVNKITFGTLSAVNSISSDDLTVSVFPNPATNYITIINQHTNSVELCIISLDGRKLLQKIISSNYGTVDVSKLAKGIYLLKINNTTIKLIKK